MLAYNLFKSLAFQMDPELAHETSIQLLSKFPGISSQMFGARSNNIDQFKTSLHCGLEWGAPVGLAAGLDKNAKCYDFFSKIGFGAIEVGTVTPIAQEGNPKPRMFRLIEDKSLLNRMGFNNDGMESVFENINASTRLKNIPLGVNLGKNKITPSDKAYEDYQQLYKKFCPVSDYLVINVSSPNTPGLRDLQNIEALKNIFDSLAELRTKSDAPLFLKISPDLSLDDIPAIIKLASDQKIAGLIATNTTIRKDIGVGGISGQLLKEKALTMRTEILKTLDGSNELDLIGVGAIDCYNDLHEFWRTGGRACQVYTSFIYQGPQVLENIYKEIKKKMIEYDVNNVDSLINAIQS